MIHLISTTKRGRTGLQIRIVFGSVTAALIWCRVYLTDLFFVLLRYGSEGMQYTASNLPALSEYAGITLWKYFVLLYLERFIGTLFVSEVVYLLSFLTRSTSFTIFAALFVFSVPALTVLLSQKSLPLLVLFAPISGNLLRNYPFLFRVLLLLVYVGSFFFVYRQVVQRGKYVRN